jgi:hypothetical protein
MLSKRIFWDWFKKEVQTRWAKHTFEWTEAGDWYWRLQDFDIETLTQAVRQHKACECYPSPNLKKVYNYAKAIQAKSKPEQKRGDNQGVPEAHTYIMCVAKDDNGRGCVGWFVPILLWPFRVQWKPEDYTRVAEQQCAIYARRGGVWKIFTHTSHSEMFGRRAKLLNIKPQGLDELRKLCKTPDRI